MKHILTIHKLQILGSREHCYYVVQCRCGLHVSAMTAKGATHYVQDHFATLDHDARAASELVWA